MTERAVLENFLRRWSTMDITPENRWLFEEHRAGVLAITGREGKRALLGLDATSGRAVFAERAKRLKGF